MRNISVFHCELFFSYIKSIYNKLGNWVIYETEILIKESIMIKKEKENRTWTNTIRKH
jgi:hypothetical protein